MARWVFAKFLNNDEPVAVQKANFTSSSNSHSSNPKLEKAIKLSDDFSKYQSVFVSASEKLINDGVCKLVDFEKMGGWWRSLIHKPELVYVTYCGGSEKDNRIYLNARTGATFK